MKRIACITGGTRGIGYGISLRLAKEGYELVLLGRKEPEKAEEMIRPLRELTRVHYYSVDLGQIEQVRPIANRIRDEAGTINVLVNNAGMAPRERRDLLEMVPESYDEVMNVNLKGPFFLSQAMARAMVDNKKKDESFHAMIINISSISARIVSINRGEYCLSKAGLSMMTQLFAVRLGEYNIPVYEIRPGIVSTDMTAGVKEKYDALINDGLCVQKRWGTPADVGKAVAALVKNEFPYSTGQVIMVDGGLSISRL